MAGESAIYKKFRAEQDAADAAYKSWEKDQWNKNSAEWTKQGYTRTDASNNAWGSKWDKINPIITSPTDPISEVKEEKIPETIAKPKEENTTPTTYDWNQTPVWNNVSSQPTKVVTKKTPLSGLNIDPKYGQKVDIKGDFEKFLSWLTGTSVSFNKQGGTMNKVKYFAQGGAPTQEQVDPEIQAKADDLVLKAMQGDTKSQNSVKAIIDAAKKQDAKALQLLPYIQRAMEKAQSQAASAKWGSKLQYIRSLKFAKGGKNCPACMAAGGQTKEKSNTHIAPSDTVHVQGKPKSLVDSQGKKTVKHLPEYTASDYQKDLKDAKKGKKDAAKRVEKQDMKTAYGCGGKAGKAKKRYFGGWL